MRRIIDTSLIKKFGLELLKPNYDIHMTISKVHETNGKPWGFLNGKIVDISVDKELMWNNEFVWLNAYSKEWGDIREFYGFERYNNGHITIGKFKKHDQFLIEPNINKNCIW